MNKIIALKLFMIMYAKTLNTAKNATKYKKYILLNKLSRDFGIFILDVYMYNVYLYIRYIIYYIFIFIFRLEIKIKIDQ